MNRQKFEQFKQELETQQVIKIVVWTAMVLGIMAWLSSCKQKPDDSHNYPDNRIQDTMLVRSLDGKDTMWMNIGQADHLGYVEEGDTVQMWRFTSQSAPDRLWHFNPNGVQPYSDSVEYREAIIEEERP